MAQAHGMPDTYGYKHTLEMCNTCCFYATRVDARTSLNVTLHVHCLCCYYLTHSIPFKFISSLPNQRYPSPLFIPINPLGLLPNFLISSPCLPLVTAFYRVPFKIHVPNFTALIRKHLAFPAFTTKFPFCCSLCCVLCPSYDIVTNSSLHFINTFPSPFSHPHNSTMGYSIRGGRIKNRNKLHVIFIIVSSPPVVARSMA